MSECMQSTPEALPEHAGFLMALGLNRHITNLATMNTYEYLCRSHEMISIAILIGLAAAKRGIFLYYCTYTIN